jgi:hypothetical protein
LSGIPGAIESMSLLCSNTPVSATDSQNMPGVITEHEEASPVGRGYDYDHLTFNLQ